MLKHEIEGRLGLVSNCWKMQLDAGVSLHKLVEQAAAEGFRFVELRQGCLGECEDSVTRLPRVELLKKLAQDFPEITFDLAVELPVFSEPVEVSTKTVETMLFGAIAISMDDRPAHLRIVDLVSKRIPDALSVSDTANEAFSLEDVIKSLRSLQTQLQGGIVSVEHSFQPWAGFQRLFEVFRSKDDSANVLPQICYDPCNLWLSNDGENADRITSLLPIGWLSMVHLKQRIGDSISTRLESGKVDWSRQIQLLIRAGYRGPFLFETAPSDDIWECLADSRRYLASLACEHC